jgi:hypothetical protein
MTAWITTSTFGLGFWVAMVAVALVLPITIYRAMRFGVFSGTKAGARFQPSDMALCAGLALAVVLVFWGRLTNHDIAWYLFATRDWLAGAELYVDIIEVNPPLYFYMTRPALFVAELFQISGANGHTVTVAVLLFVSLVWCGAILRSDFALSTGQRAMFLVGIALAALLPTLNGLGQREQVLVLCLLPWSLCEASARRSTPQQGLSTALFASAGVCLKPHFVVLPIAVTLLNCLESRSLRPVLSLGNLVFVVVGLAYLGFVGVVHPAYLTEIVPIALEVYAAYGSPLHDLVLRIGYVIVPMSIFLLVVASGKGLSREIRVFVALALGGLLSFLMQGAGFDYHKVPAVAFSAIACFFALVAVHRTRQEVMLAAIVLALLAISGIGQGFYRNGAVPVTKAIAADLGPIDSLMTLSSHLYTGPPLALALGIDWASGYPANWLVPGAVNRLALTDCEALPDTCNRLRQIAARNRIDNITDITKNRPDLLIVDLDSGYFDMPRFDWLVFMSEDPAWSEAFAPYRQVAENERFLYFLRDH